jgi:DNA alkylation repair enzyme
MPAIDLEALRRWSQALGNHLSDPQTFASMLRWQFESHSNRMLRRGPSLARHGALPSWNIPPAMMNEIEAAVLPRAALEPEPALRLADHLWSIPSLEEKTLGARLVGAAGRSEASHMRLSQWIAQTKDRSLIAVLARYAAQPIRAESPELFRREVLSFLADRNPGARRFAWRMVLEWLAEAPSAATRLALEVLSGALREIDPECVQLSQQVFALLAGYSPAEALRWLEDLPDRDAEIIGRRWLRGALAALPRDVAAAVRARLDPQADRQARSG